VGLFSRRRSKPKSDLHVADPRFDEWEIVADFEDVQTARAFAGRLTELGIENALTTDWPLDRHGRGDVALRVPGERYGDATVALEGLDA
jgi:phage replication-related protein YjqB (UPF0714/DUF867 family)